MWCVVLCGVVWCVVDLSREVERVAALLRVSVLACGILACITRVRSVSVDGRGGLVRRAASSSVTRGDTLKGTQQRRIQPLMR